MCTIKELKKFLKCIPDDIQIQVEIKPWSSQAYFVDLNLEDGVDYLGDYQIIRFGVK